LAKAEMRVLRSEVGAGRSLFAVLRLAVRESLLPKSTVQRGPPSFETNSKGSHLILYYKQILYYRGKRWDIIPSKEL
jgi:hypothetical protein